jgi:hypothetical protein
MSSNPVLLRVRAMVFGRNFTSSSIVIGSGKQIACGCTRTWRCFDEDRDRQDPLEETKRWQTELEETGLLSIYFVAETSRCKELEESNPYTSSSHSHPSADVSVRRKHRISLDSYNALKQIERD